MDWDFGGKSVLVTGAASGIGRAIAEGFATAGANVLLADRDERLGRAAATECDRLGGGESRFVRTDVTNQADIDGAVSLAADRFGGLQFAVNNAGITGPAKLAGDLTDDDWEAVIGVNLTAVFRCLRAEVGLLRAGGGGAIVNIASTAGLRGGKGTAAYGASKHGVVGLTRSAALDYARHGIRINAVCPGAIETPMLSRLLAPNPRLRERLAERSVMGRNGQAGEIAGVVLWLCSDAASFVNGQAIAVDGGTTA